MRVSQTLTIQSAVKLYVMDCWSCGIVYGVPDDYDKRRRADGKSWSCPNGHGTIYSEYTDAEKLHSAEVKLAGLQAKLDQAWATAAEAKKDKLRYEREARKAEREAKRLATRAEAGVCVHCHRTFQNMARHMVSKHGIVNGGVEIVVPARSSNREEATG